MTTKITIENSPTGQVVSSSREVPVECSDLVEDFMSLMYMTGWSRSDIIRAMKWIVDAEKKTEEA